MHRALLWITIVSLVGLALASGTIYVLSKLQDPRISIYPGLTSATARQVFWWCDDISSVLRPIAYVSLALYLLSVERLRRSTSSGGGFEVIGRAGDGR